MFRALPEEITGKERFYFILIFYDLHFRESSNHLNNKCKSYFKNCLAPEVIILLLLSLMCIFVIGAGNVKMIAVNLNHSFNN